MELFIQGDGPDDVILGRWIFFLMSFKFFSHETVQQFH